MEDIISIKVVINGSQKKFFLTWGRIFSPLDEEYIIEIMKKYLPNFGIRYYKEISICESLQECSSERYFFENLFIMSQEKIPFGVKYKQWKISMAKKMKQGKEIYFLG